MLHASTGPEFVKFLKRLDAETEPPLTLHVVLDNASAHRSAAARRWLARHPRFHLHFISHETIYRSLFVQKSRGVLKMALLRHLRRRRTMRRSQHATTAGQRRGEIVDAVSIRERSAVIEDRAIPGHWEGDLIAGAANSHDATLVERQSRYLMLVRVAGKDTASVVQALTRHVRMLPRELMSSLTWDRGTELAAHKRFTVATDVQVYFCDPQSPWQHGSNENTNGLLRQSGGAASQSATQENVALPNAG